MSNRADTALWYGETGTGKTAQIGEVAKWWYKRTGQVTRLISADSGWDPIEHLIGDCVEAWNIQYLPNPFAVLIKLSEGAWPEPYTKPDGSPGLRMVAATPDTWKRVGIVAIEGISTIADMLMQDHIRNQRKIGQDVVGTFTDKVQVRQGGKDSEQVITFAKAAQSHFGQVQDMVLLDLVPRFASLPVAQVIWTGHEAKGADDVVKEVSVLGPATVGRAAVGRTAQKFGDTWHFVKELETSVDPQTRATRSVVNYRAYFEKHPDDVLKTMYWPAKLSLPLEKAVALKSRFQGSFVPLSLDKGMVEYMEFKYGPQTAKAGEAAK